MSSSLLLRRPALSRHIGPVAAPDRRLATRYANSLRAGEAAPVEDLHGCGLVLVHASTAGLRRILPLLHEAGPWKGSHFALISADLDASSLGGLRAAGARVCSVMAVPARGRDLTVIEGDKSAVVLARQWLEEGHMRCFELAPDGRALFQLGLWTARGLLGTLLDAALKSLRASGLGAAEALRLLYDVADASLRAFAARGRKALEDPASYSRSAFVFQGIEDAARRRPELAQFLADVIEASARFHSPELPAAAQDSRVPGRAAGIT